MCGVEIGFVRECPPIPSQYLLVANQVILGYVLRVFSSLISGLDACSRTEYAQVADVVTALIT